MYPHFLCLFKIHTDASDYQIRAVISQNNKPIVFYSCKLNAAQTRYTSTEKEIITIIKTLKDILFGQDIKVYTDHKKLMYKTHNSARVMCWRLTIEEFGPELIYIPGNKKIVADALSCLPLDKATNDNLNDSNYCADLLALRKDNFPPHVHFLNYKTIMRHQQEDKDLLAAAQRNTSYVVKDFTAAGQVRKLI